MSNIIPFPNNTDRSIITNKEQMAEAVRTMRTTFVEMLTDDIGQTIMWRAHIEGFDLAAEKCTKSFGLSLEAIKATLLKSIDIDHFLHDFADSCVVVDPLPDIDEEDDDEQ